MKSALLLLMLAGCPGPDKTCTGGWAPLAPTDRPLLSAWSSGADVFAVGGGLGSPGLGGVALHWDGSAWRDLPVAHDETLWWVWGASVTDVWMAGEHGLLLRWNGAAFTTVATGTTATLYGVWGTSSSDVWIVGGTPDGGVGAANDLVFHWDGQSLTQTDAPPAKGAAFFKVWGSPGAVDDLWVSGEGGTLWHRDAAGWTDFAAQLATRSPVTTIHGCAANDVWAVAGQSVFHFDGAAWTVDAGAHALSGANGVACGAANVLVVGNGGLKLRLDRATGVWGDETLQQPFGADFHGALVSGDGVLWAVGGNYNAPASAPRYGQIGVFGCPVPADP